MSIETIAYAGWPNCLRLAEGPLEAVITTDVGPRILRFGPAGDANLLFEAPAHRGLTGGDAWRSYGGHRLWHAPEAKPRTYVPDNGPVAVQVEAGRVRLVQPVEPGTGIQKTLELRLGPDRLELVHRLTNRGPWPVRLAPWAITQVAPGGEASLPREPFAPHPDYGAASGGTPSYLPGQGLALWAYTRLDDPRLGFRDGLIRLRQDPAVAAPLKLGLDCRQGWCAYRNQGWLFVKRFPWREGADYPDRGCNAELFVDGAMLEMESLGPLVDLEPGASVEHPETWQCLPAPAGSLAETLAALPRPE